MDSEHRKTRVRQIVKQLEGRETDDLLNIWKKNDRQEWSDEAFDAIREILSQRIDSLPPQGMSDAIPGEDEEEEADTYYNFEQFIRISSYARILSWLFLGGAVVLTLARFLKEVVGVRDISLDSLVTAIINYFFVLLSGAFSFVVLQALAEGIYLLIDIESNTRPTKGINESPNSK